MRAGAAIPGVPGKGAAGVGKPGSFERAPAGATSLRGRAFTGAFLAADAAAPKQSTQLRADIAAPAALPQGPSPPASASPSPCGASAAKQPVRPPHRAPASAAAEHSERSKPHADPGPIDATPETPQDAHPPASPPPPLPFSSGIAATIAPTTPAPAGTVPPAGTAGLKPTQIPGDADVPHSAMKTPALATEGKQPPVMTSGAPSPPTSQPTLAASVPLAAPVAAPPVTGGAPVAPSPPPPTPPATAATPAPPHSPVAQLAPAVVTFAAPASATQHLTVRLSPPELGSVTIRVERPPEAPPRVEVTVQHSQTLSLMLRDEPQLHHALDQAGIATEGRTLTFHLSDPGGGGSGNSGAENDPPAATGRTAPRAGVTDELPDLAAMPVAWRRAGLDITA